MITEKNKPIDILMLLFFKFLELNIIIEEKITIKIKYKGYDESLCKWTSTLMVE